MRSRWPSRILVGVLAAGGLVAVLQPMGALPVAGASPVGAPGGDSCTTVSTLTGTTTSLGELVTSTTSTFVTSTLTETWSLLPPLFLPFPIEAWVTSTGTTTVPETLTTTATETTTSLATSTSACPTSTTSSATAPTTTVSSAASVTTSSAAAPADASYVDGLVTHDSGQPLQGAVVSVGNATDVSDAGGHFRVGPLPAGAYTTTVRYPDGYRPASASSYPVDLDGAGSASFAFYAVQGPAAAFTPAASGFAPVWVETDRPVTLWSGTDDHAVALGTLPRWSALLVARPQAGPWLYVYNPQTRNYAYVEAAAVGPAGPPVVR
jgi:hypothetical protein